MPYFPLFVELKGVPSLVVGGGKVALGKARQLLSYGAEVTVVAPKLVSGLSRLAKIHKVRWRKHPFRPADLAGARVVVAATDDPPVNEAVSRLARRKGVLVNVVDQPALCSFVFPSIVRRGRLVLAISTGGASPALARWIRRDLEERYGPEYGRGLEVIARVRQQVMRRERASAARKKLFEQALQAYLRVIRKGGGHA